MRVAFTFIPLSSRVIAKCSLEHYAVESIAGSVPKWGKVSQVNGFQLGV